MDFKDIQPIYLQIADWVCEQILTEKWKTASRALSVRELGVIMEVNPNTVLRSYDYLQTQEIIVNKRGVGYFVNENAVEKIINLRKKHFFEQELPIIFKNMQLLNISMSDLDNAYQTHTIQNSKN